MAGTTGPPPRLAGHHDGHQMVMALLLILLFIALLFGGAALAIHWLWIAAVVVAIAWLVGYGLRRGGGGSWYRW